MSVIRTEGLSKYFKDLCAVNSVDLEVGNEVFGLLGPNGAGKSTIVKMLTTLLKPSGGEAYVCGHSVSREPVKVRDRISYVPQEMAVDIKLTGRENVRLYAELYGIRDIRMKVDEVLCLMDLTERADDLVRSYSGGMRRRLELAQALVHEPDVLFLDEPTLGLDVGARKKIWEHVHSLKKGGMTIFMTTHYMDEADRYCDRVAIIDRGNIVAMDTPQMLKGQIGQDVITACISGKFGGLSIDGVKLMGSSNGEIKFIAENGKEALPLISSELSRQGVTVHSLSMRGPTLDDVFLHKVAAKEDESSFNDRKYRIMLRRR